LLGLLAFVSGGQWVPALLGIAVLVLLLCARKLNFSREWLAAGRVLGNSREMRQEIQCALLLTRWLALEGARQPSLASLWPDLVFVVQRLGFTSVNLRLADNVHTWRHCDEADPMLLSRQELRGGQTGVLELRAPDLRPAGATSPGGGQSPAGEAPNCRPISDPALFQILAELVAEGWLKATRKWQPELAAPLSFSSKPLVRVQVRQAGPAVIPVRLTQDLRSAIEKLPANALFKPHELKPVTVCDGEGNNRLLVDWHRDIGNTRQPDQR